MRNLIQFIWRFHHIFLFLLLETVAIGLVVRHNNYQRAGFLNMTNEVSGSAYDLVNNVSEYVELRDANQALLLENAELRNRLRSSKFNEATQTDSITDTIYQQQYAYVGAKVINRSAHRQNNSITLNVGSNHGVAVDMGVFGPDGVIGVVRSVSPHYSAVLPILHSKSRISTRIKKNNYYGILRWDGSDPLYATLDNIPNIANIGEGDTLVTDGASAIFPEGILVGYIEGFRQKPGTNYYQVSVRLATNFKQISYAYVVKNLLKAEQLELEAEEEGDE